MTIEVLTAAFDDAVSKTPVDMHALVCISRDVKPLAESEAKAALRQRIFDFVLAPSPSPVVGTRRYRTRSMFTPLDEPNERRADQIERALTVCTDALGNRPEEEPNGVFTDVSDMLASVRHFCDRAGLDYGEVDEHAHRAYLGDHEGGQLVARDAERFPGPRSTL